MKDVGEMSEEELKAELQKIREERSGKGRIRRAQGRTKRIEEGVKLKRTKERIQARSNSVRV